MWKKEVFYKHRPKNHKVAHREYHRLFRRLKNSSLVFALDLIAPSIQLVVVEAPGFWTPLITMQKWLDSITTATPRGFNTSAIARATCFVNLSCTCSLRENISANRANFDRPMTRRFGIYPICIYHNKSGFNHYISIVAAYLACKWHHMVFAKREYLNVLHNDQLVVILMEHSTVD